MENNKNTTEKNGKIKEKKEMELVRILK